MAIFVGPRGVRNGAGELTECIWRLESLAVDLKLIGEGWLPSAGDLEDAPLLDPYVVTARQALSLAGGNHGHPLLRGSLIRTSELWVLAPELGWARTFSRFYRLGRKLGEVAEN